MLVFICVFSVIAVSLIIFAIMRFLVHYDYVVSDEQGHNIER